MNTLSTSVLCCALLGLSLVTPARAQSASGSGSPVAQPAATPVLAAGPAAPLAPGFGTPTKLVEEFFNHLKTNSVEAGYSALLRDSKIADSKEDVATLKTKTREAIRAFGDVLGWDLVSTKQVGSHLVSYTYIAAAKSYPIRWRFFFYKASDIWKLVDIRIDDRLMRMFDEVEPAAPAASADSGQ